VFGCDESSATADKETKELSPTTTLEQSGPDSSPSPVCSSPVRIILLHQFIRFTRLEERSTHLDQFLQVFGSSVVTSHDTSQDRSASDQNRVRS